MKKMFLVGALALFGAMNAQQGKGNFKLGAHLGFPTGDLSSAYSFNLGVDVAYVFPIAQDFKLGVTTGYSHFIGKTVNESVFGYSVKYDVEDTGIIPVAATAQYTFGDSNVFLGADLGYAFFTKAEGVTGAFYYQPKVGYTFTKKHDVYLGYKGMSREGSSLGSFNLGYAYNF